MEMQTVREIVVSYKSPKKTPIKITEPKHAADTIRKMLTTNTKEHFCALYLDGNHQIVARSTITIGLANSTQVHPREVYQNAVACGAIALIVGHNHPSNNPEPSSEDIRVTVSLAAAGKVLGIELLDHVIVTDTGFTSLRETGAL